MLFLIGDEWFQNYKIRESHYIVNSLSSHGA